MREVAWRHSTPGSPVTDEDREYIRIHGMKPKEGMKSIDFLRAIDHVLDSNLGRPLLSFSLVETLSPLDTLAKLPIQQQRFLVGNSMLCPVVAAWVFYILSNLQPLDVPTKMPPQLRDVADDDAEDLSEQDLDLDALAADLALRHLLHVGLGWAKSKDLASKILLCI